MSSLSDLERGEAMALKWPSKDPDETLDYKVDWSKRLGSDTIAASAWPVLPEGITTTLTTFTPKAVTIWLTGGDLGRTYTFVNRITTTAGRVMDQSVSITIKAR
jgi:hypothetical protein